MAINLTGKWIEGDIWLSRDTIKIILLRDLNEIPDITPEVRNYIFELIERLEKISTG